MAGNKSLENKAVKWLGSNLLLSMKEWEKNIKERESNKGTCIM